MSSRTIPASDNHLVWYAGYGSNLLRKRFDCYIKGGRPEGSNKDYPGCQDKTAPRADRQVSLRYALYFADLSNSWNGAIAFVKRAESDIHTYGRMYLISYGQFNDVVRQENGRSVPGDIIVPPYQDLAGQDQWHVNSVRLYDRIIKTGTQDGHPILTLTGDNPAVGPPSEAYIKTIVAGLEETCPCLRKSEIIDYLRPTEGIRGAIQGDVLARWILDR